MIVDLTDYELKMYVYKEDTDGGVIYVVYKNAPKDIQKELKKIDDDYFKFYGRHLIEFELEK